MIFLIKTTDHHHHHHRHHKCTFFSHTDIPAADEINSEINYSQEDKHITASLTFQNIYPLPECMLSITVCLRNVDQEV
jgi:hypothetical protein